jgi:hypothetical protein
MEDALCMLAPSASAAQRARALELATSHSDSLPVQVGTAFAADLDRDTFRALWLKVLKSEFWTWRIETLLALAPHAPSGDIEALIDAIADQKSVEFTVSMLRALAHTSPTLECSAYAKQRLAALEKEHETIVDLKSLIKHWLGEHEAPPGGAALLTDKQVSRALKRAKSQRLAENRLMILCGLFPRLADPLRTRIAREIFDTASTPTDVGTRSVHLETALPYLSSENQHAVLDFAQRVKGGDTYGHVSLISALCESAHEDLFPRLLTAIGKAGPDLERRNALRILTKRLPAPLLPQMLSIADSLPDARQRASLLSALGMAMAKVGRWEALEALLDTCRALDRADILSIVSQTLPAFEQYGGEPLIAKIRRAVLDTASWYP